MNTIAKIVAIIIDAEPKILMNPEKLIKDMVDRIPEENLQEFMLFQNTIREVPVTNILYAAKNGSAVVKATAREKAMKALLDANVEKSRAEYTLSILEDAIEWNRQANVQRQNADDKTISMKAVPSTEQGSQPVTQSIVNNATTNPEKKKRITLYAIIAVIVLLVIGVAGYVSHSNSEAEKEKNYLEAMSKVQTDIATFQGHISAINGLIEVPDGTNTKTIIDNLKGDKENLTKSTETVKTLKEPEKYAGNVSKIVELIDKELSLADDVIFILNSPLDKNAKQHQENIQTAISDIHNTAAAIQLSTVNFNSVTDMPNLMDALNKYARTNAKREADAKARDAKLNSMLAHYHWFLNKDPNYVLLNGQMDTGIYIDKKSITVEENTDKYMVLSVTAVIVPNAGRGSTTITKTYTNRFRIMKGSKLVYIEKKGKFVLLNPDGPMSEIRGTKTAVAAAYYVETGHKLYNEFENMYSCLDVK